MVVQDDSRERELAQRFNLDWNPGHQRSGVDAWLDVVVNRRRYRFDIEVKSTTGDTVSTARDVNPEHINRWRRMLFVIGFYSKTAGRPELLTSLCLTPLDMEAWASSIEAKIGIDFKIAARISGNLGIDDLFEVCGNQSTYSLDDAKRLHKKQWTATQYKAALDTSEDGEPRVSQAKMLEILQLRSKYIAERGATLNNPHIDKTRLRRFFGTEREIPRGEWASRIRELAIDFVQRNPGHPAAQLQSDI